MGAASSPRARGSSVSRRSFTRIVGGQKGECPKGVPFVTVNNASLGTTLPLRSVRDDNMRIEDQWYPGVSERQALVGAWPLT